MIDAQIKAIAELEDRHFWYKARRAIIRQTLRRLNIPAKASILEIGAGGGANAEMLAEFGELTLAEPSETFRKYLAAKSFEASDIALPDIGNLAGHEFDLIALFDVLEHVEDDLEALRNISAILRTGGKIILTVPACKFLWSRYDVSMGHFRRYSKKQLSDVAKKAGLEVEYISHFNLVLMPLVMASRGMAAVFRKEPRDVYVLPPKFINETLYNIFLSEKYLLRLTKLPLGVSLICVLKKV